MISIFRIACTPAAWVNVSHVPIMKLPLLPSILSLAAAVLLHNVPAEAADYKPKLGMQSWTLRDMNFDQAVEFATKHKLKYIQCTNKHIDPLAPLEESLKKKAILESRGIQFYTFGVAGTSMNKEENRRLFTFAKAMGIKLIIVEPREAAQWDNLEELVKEYDIKLGIHNHGLNSVYGHPDTVLKILNSRDARIGVCLDVGHVTGAGFDAAKVFRDYKGRVFDIHLKDKKIEQVDGKPTIVDVHIGTGSSNFKGLFEELRKARWDGVLAIETDNPIYARAPEEYVSQAIQFVNRHHP